MNIGKSIKRALLDKGMKQGELAKSLKTTPAYMSRVANGKAHVNTLVLEKIADEFDMPVSEFVKLGED